MSAIGRNPTQCYWSWKQAFRKCNSKLLKWDLAHFSRSILTLHLWTLHWSMDPGEWGYSSTKFCIQCCPPSFAMSTSSPGVKQVQPPSQCNVYTQGIILFLHRNHLIPGLSSSLHSLPLAVLPNRFPPSDSTPHFPPFSSFHGFCSTPLSTPCDVLIWGQGTASSLPHARFLLPTTLCLLAAPAYQQKLRSSPAEGAPAANTSCQSRKWGCISSLLKPALQLFAEKGIQTSQTTKRPLGYCAFFVVTFESSHTLSPLFLVLSSLINGDTPSLTSSLFPIVYL